MVYLLSNRSWVANIRTSRQSSLLWSQELFLTEFFTQSSGFQFFRSISSFLWWTLFLSADFSHWIPFQQKINLQCWWLTGQKWPDQSLEDSKAQAHELCTSKHYLDGCPIPMDLQHHRVLPYCSPMSRFPTIYQTNETAPNNVAGTWIVSRSASCSGCIWLQKH